MKDMLKDKRVLYVVCFIAFVNLLGYITLDNKDAVSLFLIIGLLTSFFSKNMIVISLSAMIFTNLLISLRKHDRLREGMEDKKSKSKSKPTPKPRARAKAKSKKQDDDDDNDEGMRNINEKDQTIKSISKDRARVKPSTEEIEDILTGKDPTDIDTAATIEKAMDKLDASLSDGEKAEFKKDAHLALKEQKQLMNTLKNLEPMVGQATNMLNAMGGVEGLTSMMGSLSGMMNKLDGFSSKLK